VSPLKLALTAIPLVIALSSLGCRKNRVTPEDCDRLLDRYAEAKARADDPRMRASDIERFRTEVRARAATSPGFRACPREVTREAMDCALAAFNADEIERCLVPVW
jgi:hypothetical protein